jgi:membrane protein implicated in regulation of membrane protease activity
MLISPALAFDATPGTGSSGGAIALSIIIAVAITSLVVYVILKKWRRRRLSRRDARVE